MEENLRLYNKYRKVPKEALKPFDNGRFKGTDINTMWRIKCLTEEFGICGIGWYQKLVRTWVETTPNQEQFAFAEIELYIKVNGEWSKGISGTGGNKLTRMTKDGDYSSIDEAFKMAITDAFGVACKYLGIGADVYWDNDRTKYTESAIEEKTKVAEVKYSSYGQKINETQEIAQPVKVEFICENCGDIITGKVADWSKNNFGKALCMKCQKEAKNG